MRLFLLRLFAALACLGFFSLPPISSQSKPDQPGKPNFNGIWTLDRKTSTSIEPLMKDIGASFFERLYANTAGLKATFEQTEDALTVATRGPGFALDETLYLNGQTLPSDLEILGATSVNVRTAWSNDYQELVETRQIKTRHGKDGQLTIRRHLLDEGKTLVVAFTLKLNSEPQAIIVRQLWRKQV
jgi:hypothetical protein